MSEYLVLLGSFIAVAVVVYALLTTLDPYWFRVNSRMDQLNKPDLATDKDESSRSFGSASSSAFISFLQGIFPERQSSKSKLQQRLAKAGIYQHNAVARHYATRLLASALGAGIGFALGLVGLLRMDTALLLCCVLGCLGTILPSFWLDRSIARHHLLLGKSLPDFLDLMTVCLEGGMSLQETIRRVSDELLIAHPTLATELGIVQRDMEVGATVDQALKRFAVRTDYEGVRTLSTFIREAQRFGTNITEALRSHADMLRSQREQAAEENAQKAAVKILLPTLLLIFPAIFVIAVGPAVIQIQEAFAQ